MPPPAASEGTEPSEAAFFEIVTARFDLAEAPGTESVSLCAAQDVTEQCSVADASRVPTAPHDLASKVPGTDPEQPLETPSRSRSGDTAATAPHPVRHGAEPLCTEKAIDDDRPPKVCDVAERNRSTAVGLSSTSQDGNSQLRDGASQEHLATASCVKVSGCTAGASAQDSSELSSGDTTRRCDPRPTRRARRQQLRRLQEQAARRLVVDYVQQAQQRGTSTRQIARFLKIPERTLRHWRQRSKQPPRAIQLRGRRVYGCSAEVRNTVIRFLHHVTGPAVALEALQALFPKIPRCVLEELLCRYRCVWRRRYCAFGRRLIWHVVGAVWAMDFSKAPYLIDGVYCYIFSVRDLASGYQLIWHAVPSEKAEAVIPILLDLFQRHGAPLVLKSDNGSAFIAEEMTAAMFAQLVVQLFSPAGRPSYNGALERSNTTNKLYTAQQAMGQGHPYRWSAPAGEHQGHDRAFRAHIQHPVIRSQLLRQQLSRAQCFR